MSNHLHNTSDSYGQIAKWLHWLVAFMILISYTAIYYRGWFTEPRTPPSTMALQIHMSMGITIFAFVVLRLIWRLKNTVPTAVPGPTWQQRAAKWNHRLFYFLLLAMPITGYIFAGLGNEFFYNTPLAFEFPTKFTDSKLFELVIVDWMNMTEDQWKEARKPINAIHKYMGNFVILGLLALHIGAALYHHYVLKDNTLRRMTKA